MGTNPINSFKIVQMVLESLKINFSRCRTECWTKAFKTSLENYKLAFKRKRSQNITKYNRLNITTSGHFKAKNPPLCVLADTPGYKVAGCMFKPDFGAFVLSLRDSNNNRMMLYALIKAEPPGNVTRIVLLKRSVGG
jgi:hypothetical protein